MTRGVPPTSPWQFYDSGADANGKHIRATVTFSGTLTGTDPAGWTNPLTGGTVVRDQNPDCLYTRVIIGPLNPDGTPAAGSKVLAVPAGTTTFTANQLHAAGLNTVADVANAGQITASP